MRTGHHDGPAEAVAVDETVRSADRPAGHADGLPSAIRLLVLGGLFGLTWSAGLRGFMAEVAGAGSRVDWAGTFGWILLPGVVTGMLLGWAEHLRRTGGGRGWRWLALSPLMLAAVTLHRFWELPLLFTEDPLGGGAVGVALYGLVGGYALSGRGRLWGRLSCGVIALSAIPLWTLTVTGFGGPDLAVTTPRGLWVALYFWSLLAVLGLACAIPHRPVIGPASPAGQDR
jgi:hypothetical protein